MYTVYRECQRYSILCCLLLLPCVLVLQSYHRSRVCGHSHRSLRRKKMTDVISVLHLQLLVRTKMRVFHRSVELHIYSFRVFGVVISCVIFIIIRREKKIISYITNNREKTINESEWLRNSYRYASNVVLLLNMKKLVGRRDEVSWVAESRVECICGTGGKIVRCLCTWHRKLNFKVSGLVNVQFQPCLGSMVKLQRAAEGGERWALN